MASSDTKTQQYLDVAANGSRADLPANTCCETRTQTLIRGVAERIMDVEDEVEELKNNPDVADIVATYADLRAYPVSQLTDKDIIRVLADETHNDESTYYRWSTATQTWTYIGESKQYSDFVGTDGTNAGTSGLVPAPATTDAGKFLKADGTWGEASGGGGGATELTSADYNYDYGNTGTNNCIAFWLLDTGLYKSGNGVSRLYTTASSPRTSENAALVLNYGASQTNRLIITEDANYSSSLYVVNKETGQAVTTSTGKILTTGALVQTTGTSTTNVMSQNAVTSMIYVNPRTMEEIAIGTTSVVRGKSVAIGLSANSQGGNSVSIGYQAGETRGGAVAVGYQATAQGQFGVANGNSAKANSYGSVAIGAGATATTQGEFNIGTGAFNIGYNGSKYRLLTGLYDPQSAHDAATKGYVDTAVASAGIPVYTNSAFNNLWENA